MEIEVQPEGADLAGQIHGSCLAMFGVGQKSIDLLRGHIAAAQHHLERTGAVAGELAAAGWSGDAARARDLEEAARAHLALLRGLLPSPSEEAGSPT